ncbi:MAG: hypothetical protein AB1921_08360 [Thermodesulfobacteriota bacterium]
MSTIKDLIIHDIGQVKTMPVHASAVFLLAMRGQTISSLAARAGVSRQAANADINGRKPCPRFRKQVVALFGCVPWAGEDGLKETEQSKGGRNAA